ncbi:hypothetical protein ACQPWW_03575 [Micromonospora sp. CA-240977]|uniref:hypothetical protein n=1 Tax=Micromonospora sp. CA-240977 TaxID=3239957 RepID=UPI003D915EDD
MSPVPGGAIRRATASSGRRADSGKRQPWQSSVISPAESESCATDRSRRTGRAELLQQRPDGRLKFHDLFRLYAEAELREQESDANRATLACRRATWLLDTAARAGRLFEPEPGSRPAAAGDHHWVIEVAGSLKWFSVGWQLWLYWTDVFTLSARAAQALGDDRLRAIHLGNLAWVNIACLNQYDIALEQAQEVHACAERCGDWLQMSWAGLYLGWASIGLGRSTDALTYARAAVLAFRMTGDRVGRPYGLMLWARSLEAVGYADDGIPRIERAVEAVARTSLSKIEIGALRWPSALRRELIAVADRLEDWIYPLFSGLSQRGQHRDLGTVARFDA